MKSGTKLFNYTGKLFFLQLPIIWILTLKIFSISGKASFLVFMPWKCLPWKKLLLTLHFKLWFSIVDHWMTKGTLWKLDIIFLNTLNMPTLMEQCFSSQIAEHFWENQSPLETKTSSSIVLMFLDIWNQKETMLAISFDHCHFDKSSTFIEKYQRWLRPRPLPKDKQQIKREIEYLWSI